MKRLIVNILFLGALFYSCTTQVDKRDRVNGNGLNEIQVESFDSTYYKNLTSLYESQDSLNLKKFFEEWYSYSAQFKNQENDSLINTLTEIFEAIYHPFSVEKYGWVSRPYLLKYEYAIVQTEIKYKVLKSIDNPDLYEYLSFDTLTNFFPTIEIGKAKTLYDINPYRKSLQLFLQNDSYSKLHFLNHYISTPISKYWQEYLTSPEILTILLNQQHNEAYVELRLISTGLRIYLTEENQKWHMQNIQQLWIE